jgi:hypothetical protein
MTPRNITLVLLMLLSSSFSFLMPGTLMVQQAAVVHEMKEKLEREELQVITVLTSSIRWVEPGKECLINDRMFDVKEMTASGDSVILQGLFDDKEKEIIARLGSFSAPVKREKERSDMIYQITHLVLECNETMAPVNNVDIVSNYPYSPPHSLRSTFSPPPFSPPDLT